MTKYKQAQKKAKVLKVTLWSIVGAVVVSAIALSVNSWIVELSNQGVL